MTLKERLLSTRRRRVTLALPEHHLAVTLQAPTAGEWLAYQMHVVTLGPDSLEHLTRLVAMTAIDDDGKPLLTESDCKDLPHDVLIELSRAASVLIAIPPMDATKGE